MKDHDVGSRGGGIQEAARRRRHSRPGIIGREETRHDRATMAELFRQWLSGAQVRLVDDAGHLVFIDRQDTVAHELRNFLRPQGRP